MNRAAFQALLSHWRRNPLQLLTLVAGLALATALWSGVQAINAEARASYDAAAATLGEGQYDQLVSAAGGPIPDSRFAALRRAGWLASPVVEGRWKGLRIVGLEPLTAPGGLGPVPVAEGQDLTGFLSGSTVFAHPDAAEALATAGLSVTLATDMAPGTAIMDISLAQDLLGMQGQISRFLLAPVQPASRAPLGDVAPDLSLRPAQDTADVARLTDSFHLNLTAFGFLSFAVGLFIVHSAVGLAFAQRQATVRTLRALGLPAGRLTVLMAAELALLALLGGAIGVALGYLIASALLPGVAATLQGLYGADIAGTLALRPVWWLSGLAIALAGTLAAAAGALWRLWRMPLLAAAQMHASHLAARRFARLQGLAAALLLIAALVLALRGTGLAAGFALLGCLLIGAALALPLVLDRLLALAAYRARGVVAAWFWADTRQQLPGLSLALAALLLAMAANTGVSTMVSSFRLTFTGFLDQRLASELYVVARDEDEATRLLAWVTPQVDAVLPLLSVEQQIAGLPGDVFAARDHATYRDNWRFLAAVPDVWDRLAAGNGVLVNEQGARRSNLALGDEITLAGTLRLPVIGIYGDYGNPVAQAILGETTFRATWPEVTALRFGLRLPPDRVDALQSDLRDDFGLDEGAIIDQAAIKAFSMDVFDRTFLVTGALNLLTLAVAAFAMLMSLLTLAAMRLPQLAPVWALGLTRASIARLELLRALLLAALTAVLALPLGLALAWVLLAIVNVEAFGWRLPMYLFPADWLRLGLFALLAAMVAAAWPARRLARMPPADLLRVFAHER
jgi:putative ABC transport system permease protein